MERSFERFQSKLEDCILNTKDTQIHKDDSKTIKWWWVMYIDASGCTPFESFHLTTNKHCYGAKQDTTKERGEGWYVQMFLCAWSKERHMEGKRHVKWCNTYWNTLTFTLPEISKNKNYAEREHTISFRFNHKKLWTNSKLIHVSYN